MKISVPGPCPCWTRAARVVARLGLALLVGPSSDAQAASVTHLYLLSTFTTSPDPSGGVTAPFTLTGTGGVELGLDDVCFVAGGTDAKLNIDFGSHATVILKILTGGFTRLMIAEDAGLGPFKLERCATATCNGTSQVLFDGFNSDTKKAVLKRSDFGGDSSPIDQAWLFLFDAPLDGWLRISETRNFGGTRLEVDFVGGLDPVAAAPEPTTFLLWGTTAAGLALARWRRRYRAAQ